MKFNVAVSNGVLQRAQWNSGSSYRGTCLSTSVSADQAGRRAYECEKTVTQHKDVASIEEQFGCPHQ